MYYRKISKLFFSIRKSIYSSKYDFLSLFNIFNIFLLPNLKKIIFTISLTSGLKNTTDIKIINSLSVLDFFFFKKSSVDKLINPYVKKQKSIIFIAKTIFSNDFDFFIAFFILKNIFSKNLFRKLSYLNYSFNEEGFIIFIDDLSSLEEIPDNLKKDKISLKISFYFNFKNYKLSKYIFKY